MNRIGTATTPWHLWVVGVLTLLWNAVGGFSYSMTRFGMLEQLGMSQTEIAFFESHPVWANALWAFGVWGAIAGSLLLLLRSRWATTAVAIALVGLLGTTIFQYGMVEVPESLQSPALTAMIWATTLFMLWYARKMTAEGVLR